MQNILFDMLCFISAHTQDQSVFQEQLPHMTEKEVRDTYRRLFLSESHSNQSQTVTLYVTVPKIQYFL